jgi:hypothetical protein
LITGLRASNTGYLSPGQAIAERVLDPGPGHFVEIEMDTESIPQQFGIWSLNHDIAILTMIAQAQIMRIYPDFQKIHQPLRGWGVVFEQFPKSKKEKLSQEEHPLAAFPTAGLLCKLKAHDIDSILVFLWGKTMNSYRRNHDIIMGTCSPTPPKLKAVEW